MTTQLILKTTCEFWENRWGGGCLYIQSIAYKSNPKCTFLAQGFPLLHVLYETAAAENIARQCWSPNRPFSASKLAQIFFGHLFTSFHGLNHSELFSSFPFSLKPWKTQQEWISNWAIHLNHLLLAILLIHPANKIICIPIFTFSLLASHNFTHLRVNFFIFF